MTVDDAVMQKLWKLTNELTAQLVFNRNATLDLKQQLADLQAKTAVQGSVTIASDITQTKSQEHADYNLRIANERLMEENSQLQEQLREYERWMEYIMAKFRLQNFAMAQSRKEAMHEAYRMAEQEGELTHRLQEENAILQARLIEVGAIARKAITDECYNTESIIETLEMENQGLREMLGVATDNANILATLHSGNRVSFPSTGSYMASSGSDREPQRGFKKASDAAAHEETTIASSPESVPGIVDKFVPVSSSDLNPVEQHEEKVGAEKEATDVVDGARKAKANPKKPTETVSTPIKNSTNHNQSTSNSSSSSTKTINSIDTKAANSNSSTNTSTSTSTSTNNIQSSKNSKVNGAVEGKTAGTGTGTGTGTGAGMASPGSKRNSITSSTPGIPGIPGIPGTATKSTAVGNTSASQKPKKPNRKQQKS
ncbi:hypothetical protein BGZ72_007945 [Mortierella alpina]|nr:hypothetical protein BGZ72_007945 [Mortierella alpina]